IFSHETEAPTKTAPNHFRGISFSWAKGFQKNVGAMAGAWVEQHKFHPGWRACTRFSARVIELAGLHGV
ncbi:MAG: hypothetical protein ONB49_12985, partial [candidate division KSB1 bacterium]|nr:hypothetical protein [candidate division KSB1 bacterium]